MEPGTPNCPVLCFILHSFFLFFPFFEPVASPRTHTPRAQAGWKGCDTHTCPQALPCTRICTPGAKSPITAHAPKRDYGFLGGSWMQAGDPFPQPCARTVFLGPKGVE